VLGYRLNGQAFESWQRLATFLFTMSRLTLGTQYQGLFPWR